MRVFKVEVLADSIKVVQRIDNEEQVMNLSLQQSMMIEDSIEELKENLWRTKSDERRNSDEKEPEVDEQSQPEQEDGVRGQIDWEKNYAGQHLTHADDWDLIKYIYPLHPKNMTDKYEYVESGSDEYGNMNAYVMKTTTEQGEVKFSFVLYAEGLDDGPWIGDDYFTNIEGAKCDAQEAASHTAYENDALYGE